MQTIAIVVEDEPSRDLLREMEIEPPDTLLGLYTGTPLTQRTWGYGNTLPARILIFQGPHQRESDDEDDLVVCIAETLIHEIGHYFGMDEEQIEEIEENYWRKRGRGGQPCRGRGGVLVRIFWNRPGSRRLLARSIRNRI